MDCLVTSLKAATNNTSLEKLGYFHIHVKVTSDTPTVGRQIRAVNSVNFSIETGDGSNKLSASDDFSSPTNKVNLASGSTWRYVYLLEGEYDVEISNRYTLNGLVLPSGGTVIGPCTVDISMFNYTNIASLGFAYTNLLGKVSDLINYDVVNSFGNNAGPIVGKIEDFGKFYKLATLNLWKCKGITGSIENLCIAMSATLQGRPVGQRKLVMNVDARSSKATYNGVAITKTLTITFNSDGTYNIVQNA